MTKAGVVPALGKRIQIIGNSCSGKSTFAVKLANLLNFPVVELDALNWRPGWSNLYLKDRHELERLVCDATSGDAWIVDGSYWNITRSVFWPRLDTLIWLDLPRNQLVFRMLKRSWGRWRRRELLWGTNQERFWPHLLFWRRDSLLWWIVTQHGKYRRRVEAIKAEPAYQNIRVLHLKSISEAEELLSTLKGQPD